MKIIDCRGMACPGPVLQAKQALEALSPGDSFTIEVDTEAARDNVRRFVQGRGARIAMDEVPGPAWRLTITAPPGEAAEGAKANLPPARKPPVVFIASETLGRGDDKLGGILMEGFVNSLAEQETIPDLLLLMNGGVRLAIAGSHVLPSLVKLADRGCEILACGTCLDFFGVKDKIAAGRVSNMFEIQNHLLKASSVIRP